LATPLLLLVRVLGTSWYWACGVWHVLLVRQPQAPSSRVRPSESCVASHWLAQPAILLSRIPLPQVKDQKKQVQLSLPAVTVWQHITVTSL
jgi:hypothetical protein